MDNLSSLSLARQKRKELVLAQRFALDWRGGGESEQLTFTELCKYLCLKPQSLRVYLANGHGSFSVERNNPLTNEMDILTITRLTPKAKPKPPRGRPPRQVDWERMGSEAPGYPEAGAILAPPAKTVPKRRNRRTDDNKLRNV